MNVLDNLDRGRPCKWHEYGVPEYAQGGNWADPNCPMCRAKIAAGKVPSSSPTPYDFMLARKLVRFAKNIAIRAARKRERKNTTDRRIVDRGEKCELTYR